MQRIYLASPFFNDDEMNYVRQVEDVLRQRGLKVFSPRTIDVNKDNMTDTEWAAQVFQIDRTAIENSDIVIAVYWGMYSDSGTAWEIGYAYGLRKKVVVLCVDPMQEQSLMVINGSTITIGNLDVLADFDFESMFTMDDDFTNSDYAYVPEKQM